MNGSSPMVQAVLGVILWSHAQPPFQVGPLEATLPGPGGGTNAGGGVTALEHDPLDPQAMATTYYKENNHR